MPKYQIKDNQTGKTVTVQGDHAPSQSDAEGIFQKAGLRGQQTKTRDQEFDQGKIESLLDNSGKGLFDIPVAGGVARAIAHPTLQAGNMAAELGKLGAHALTKPNEDYQIGSLSPSQIQAMSPSSPDSGIVPAALSGAKTGVGVGINRMGGELLKGVEGLNLVPGTGILSKAANKAIAGFPVGAGFETGRANSTPESVAGAAALGSALNVLIPALTSGMLTKSGASRKATQAAEKSTDQGRDISWNKISQDIKDKVHDQYGDTPEVNKSLNRLLHPEDKFGQLDTRPITKTPTDLLNWRRQILSREGSNIFKTMFTGSDLDQKIAGTARSAISQKVHELAPGTVMPDKVFTAYSALHGDVPKLLVELLGFGAVAKLIGGGLFKGD